MTPRICTACGNEIRPLDKHWAQVTGMKQSQYDGHPPVTTAEVTCILSRTLILNPKDLRNEARNESKT